MAATNAIWSPQINIPVQGKYLHRLCSKMITQSQKEWRLQTKPPNIDTVINGDIVTIESAGQQLQRTCYFAMLYG